MGSPHGDRSEQAAAVIDRLAEDYPDATISLDFTNRLELLVAVMLSAQCTDERVNQVTPDLFERYREPEDYVEAGPERLAEETSSITYFNQKARWIVETCERIIEEHGGEVPGTMEELIALPGVGRKTANVVLHHGHDAVEGIIVDTHVMRLSRRLGLTERASRDAIERDLMDVVDEPDWRRFTHLLIAHGRATCSARNPDCEACAIEDICPSSRLDGGVDLASGEAWK